MIIEKLKREDLPKYKALMDEAFNGSEDIANYLKYDESSSAYEIIVLKEKDELVGSVTMYKLDLFTFSFQPTIELFNVAVKESYRRQNLGRILMNYVMDYAKEHGYKTIHFTCLESEKNVHDFYESCGFTKAESRKYNMYL
ncbi:MAG: GNAT family N-acetyltransferase [Clostridia bacterium]|nr:GNAT family N-acetyltransferase [Clostridia bacterium]